MSLIDGPRAAHELAGCGGRTSKLHANSLSRTASPTLAQVSFRHRKVASARRVGGRRQLSASHDPSLVEGDLAHRRGLLLNPRLPAGDRAACSRCGGADRHRDTCRSHAVRRRAHIRASGEAQLRWPGLNCHAREPARRLERQTTHPSAARFRGHRFRDHDDVVGSRRSQARDRKSLSASHPW